MSFQYVWDNTFESLPDNNTYGYLIDDYFRQLYVAIRERMQVDHIWESAQLDGAHNKASLAKQPAKPTVAAGYGYVYSKDVGAGAIELFYEDTAGNETQLTNAGNLTAATTAAIQALYPIGCIYTTTVATNPATVLGFGTWAAFGAGRVLVGNGTSDAAYAAGATGGESTHTLTTTEMPAHTHTKTLYLQGSHPEMYGGELGTGPPEGSSYVMTTDATGGGGAHNNLQPYIVVYFWTRVS